MSALAGAAIAAATAAIVLWPTARLLALLARLARTPFPGGDPRAFCGRLLAGGEAPPPALVARGGAPDRLAFSGEVAVLARAGVDDALRAARLAMLCAEADEARRSPVRTRLAEGARTAGLTLQLAGAGLLVAALLAGLPLAVAAVPLVLATAIALAVRRRDLRTAARAAAMAAAAGLPEAGPWIRAIADARTPGAAWYIAGLAGAIRTRRTAAGLPGAPAVQAAGASASPLRARRKVAACPP